ncbi:MAG: 6-phosphogluconolactonase [Acidobacteria bacterium]|nr:6-phosphogluconolactonase [Acidobacteriota bacterium]
MSTPRRAPAAPVAVRRFRRPERLDAAFTSWLTGALRAAPGRFVALAVGESTLPLYGALPAGDALWGERRILPVDELVPPPATAERALSSRLGAALPPDLRWRLVQIGAAIDPDAEAKSLEALLEREGICAVALGLGPDGHIAFNQPGSGRDTGVRVVDVSPENRARLGDVRPATRALTIGVATILRAARVALVVGGEGKSDALRRVLDGPEGADLPASWLRRHPRLTVLIEDECD